MGFDDTSFFGLFQLMVAAADAPDLSNVTDMSPMSYGAFAFNQDVSIDPVVVFQTVNATIALHDSTGNLIDTGEAAYYAGGWHIIGTTSGGQVSI